MSAQLARTTLHCVFTAGRHTLHTCPRQPPAWRLQRWLQTSSPVCMGRRSAKIAGRKGKQDNLKAKLYGRIGKLISKEARSGGADPVANIRLGLILRQAKQAGVPNDIIARNLARGQDKTQGDFSEVTYEAYSASGSGFIVECLTDNPNRSNTLIRTVIAKTNAKLAEPGSVAFQFKHCGQIVVAPTVEEDQVLEAAADAGADDVEPSLGEDGEVTGFRVLSAVSDFAAVREALNKQGLPVDDSASRLVYIPLTIPEDVSDEKLELDHQLAEKLLAIDDVDAIYTSSGVH